MKNIKINWIKYVIVLIGLIAWLPSYANVLEQCAKNLTKGNKHFDSNQVLKLLRENSIRIDDEFLINVLVLIRIESGFNPNAISPAKAVGLMQLTEIAVQDLGYDFVVDTIILPDYNIYIGTRFLNLVYSRNSTWTETLVAYNAGQKFANKLKIGGKIPRETSAYITNFIYLKERYCK